MREDKPIALKGWRPENYSREYHGPVTLTQALAHSLNTVSVRLTLGVRPDRRRQTAYRLGIASKLEANPSLALGTSEVSLIELVSAYAPFANGGKRDRALCGRAHQHQGRPDALPCARRTISGAIIEPRYVAMMNAMMRETLRVGTAQQGAVAGLAGRRQDRHQPGFPRRLVHRLHRATSSPGSGSATTIPRRRAARPAAACRWRSGRRFMRGAHQGVAVAGLPGHRGAVAASIVQHALHAPPPAHVEPSPGAQPQRTQQPGGGLDGWLIDTLFGRR